MWYDHRIRWRDNWETDHKKWCKRNAEKVILLVNFQMKRKTFIVVNEKWQYLEDGDRERCSVRMKIYKVIETSGEWWTKDCSVVWNEHWEKIWENIEKSNSESDFIIAFNNRNELSPKKKDRKEIQKVIRVVFRVNGCFLWGLAGKCTMSIRVWRLSIKNWKLIFSTRELP